MALSETDVPRAVSARRQFAQCRLHSLQGGRLRRNYRCDDRRCARERVINEVAVIMSAKIGMRQLSWI